MKTQRMLQFSQEKQGGCHGLPERTSRKRNNEGYVIRGRDKGAEKKGAEEEGTGEHGEGGILRWLRQGRLGRGEVGETGVEGKVREGRDEARGERRGVG